MAPAPSLEAAEAEAGGAAPRQPGLLRDTLTLGTLAGVAKLAGAAKSVAIAAAFGSSPALDSYLLAFLVPSVLADTFCGALVPVAVPALMELEYREGRAASIAFSSRLLLQSVSMAALAAVAIALGATAYLQFSAPPKQAYVCRLTLLMLPVLPLNTAANVWRAVLNSRQRFAVPAIAVVLTPAAIAAAALIERGRGSVWMLALATTLGAAAELVMLAWAVRRAGFPLLALTRGTPVPAFPRALRKEYAYLAASGAVSGASMAIGQTMAASLGAGAVSTLNYGTRLAGVLMSLGPAALGVAILPRFARMAAEGAWDLLWRSLRRLLWRSTAGTGAVAAIFLLFSAPIVRIAFERGAFTSADTAAVAQVQAWSLLQMPFITGISILLRIVTTLRANRVLLPLSAGALVVNVALNGALMHRYGVAGISCAASLTQALLFAGMARLVFGTRNKENR